MMKWLSLIAGSCLGGVARYALAGFVHQVMRPTFPYGTFLVNMLGCFLIGFFVVLAEEKFLLGPNTRIFLMIGFCGAFTTFSTFMLETAHLIRDGSAIRAFINVMGSVAIGFVAFRLGVILGEVL